MLWVQLLDEVGPLLEFIIDAAHASIRCHEYYQFLALLVQLNQEVSQRIWLLLDDSFEIVENEQEIFATRLTLRLLFELVEFLSVYEIDQKLEHCFHRASILK